jgi:hypothetical protein
MIESDCGISSPLTSPLPSTTSDERTFELSQSIVIKDTERDAGTLGMQSHSPTSNTSSATSEKKRGGPAPLIVMNPTPPPPYTPLSPEAPCPSPAFAATPAPAISHPPGRAIVNQAANTSSNSIFPPHPNAPKPNLSPQGRLYGRVMPPAQPTTFHLAYPDDAQGCSDACHAERTPAFQHNLRFNVHHTRSFCGCRACTNLFFGRPTER